MMVFVIFLIVWLGLSFLSWVFFLESDVFGGNSKFRSFLLMMFLVVTLPATTFIIALICCQSVLEWWQEWRAKRKALEAAKYGIFERRVLIEKYCYHMWENMGRSNSSALKMKFRCVKCKKITEMNLGEYSKLRDFGMIVNEHPAPHYRYGRWDEWGG